mgnify:CR=1 FL=1
MKGEILDGKKVLTPFTREEAVEGTFGYFGDTYLQLEDSYNKGDIRELVRVDEGHLIYPFYSGYDPRDGVLGWSFFLPASYEDSQRHWVIKNNLQVGDKVKITRDWEIGEQGYTDSYHFHIGETFIVNEILHNTIGAYEEDRKGEGWSWNLPYFAIEKVTEEYRPFKDAEEFKPYRDEWFYFISPEGIKIYVKFDRYSDEGVFTTVGGKNFPYKYFLEEFFFDATGEPAGVKL